MNSQSSQNEEWRVISVAPDYSVSDQGRVKRTALSTDKPIGKAKLGYELQAFPNNSGYYRVFLRNEGWGKYFTVHSLVMAAFVGERPEGYHINHINGDKSNNSVGNLQYMSPTDNIKHAHETGLIKSRKGKRNTILTKEQRTELITRHNEGGITFNALAKIYNVSVSTVSDIVTGRSTKKDGVDRRRKLTDLDIQHMRGWHKCGFSVTAIAKEYQTNYPHAWHVINNVPHRSRKSQGGAQ